jgi:hypothetical protein
MRLLDQATMARLFDVTDEIPLDREALEVELERRGEGELRRLPNGTVRITLPDSDDLEPFLQALPDRLGRLP